MNLPGYCIGDKGNKEIRERVDQMNGLMLINTVLGDWGRYTDFLGRWRGGGGDGAVSFFFFFNYLLALKGGPTFYIFCIYTTITHR